LHKNVSVHIHQVKSAR